MPRIALTHFPRPPWWGTPSNLARALEDSGMDVTRVVAAAPAPIETRVLNAVTRLRKDRREAVFGREVTTLRELALRVRLRKLARLDRLIQIGFPYSLPGRTPALLYEDRTIAQAVALYPQWQKLSPPTVEAWHKRQRRAFDRAFACCTATHWVADSIVRDYGVPEEKVHVVGIGRHHDPRPAGRDWEVPRFLLVGHGFGRKNGAAVLRVFTRLRAAIPNATLDLVGRDHPRIDAPGVTVHGHLRLDLPDEAAVLDRLYESATCFVLPSHRETCGVVYSEAGAAGVPSIGTTVGGAAELIGDGGRLVVPGDDESLLATMRELSDPDTARRLGGLAKERSKLFTWELVAQRILRALELDDVRKESLAPFL